MWLFWKHTPCVRTPAVFRRSIIARLPSPSCWDASRADKSFIMSETLKFFFLGLKFHITLRQKLWYCPPKSTYLTISFYLGDTCSNSSHLVSTRLASGIQEWVRRDSYSFSVEEIDAWTMARYCAMRFDTDRSWQRSCRHTGAAAGQAQKHQWGLFF